MPTFDTPEPISAAIDSSSATSAHRQRPRRHRRRRAPERRDQRAGRPGRRADPGRATRPASADQGAEAAALGLFGKTGSSTSPRLPAGSRRARRASVGGVPLPGQLGDCRVKTSRRRRPARPDRPARPGHRRRRDRRGPGRGPRRGHHRLRQDPRAPDRRHGRAQELQRRHWIGEVAGDLRANAANGDVTVDHAAPTSPPAPPTATSGSARSSAARPRSRPPSARSRSASTRAPPPGSTCTRRSARCATSWTPSDGPGPADETVEVHARTSFGDIVIRRAVNSPDTRKETSE